MKSYSTRGSKENAAISNLELSNSDFQTTATTDISTEDFVNVGLFFVLVRKYKSRDPRCKKHLRRDIALVTQRLSHDKTTCHQFKSADELLVGHSFEGWPPEETHPW